MTSGNRRINQPFARGRKGDQTRVRPLRCGALSGSRMALAKHLALLEGAGLVWKKRAGMNVFYGMQQETLSGTLATFLQAVCPPSRALKKETRARKAEDGG